MGTAALVVVAAVMRVWMTDEMAAYPAGTQTAVGAVAYYVMYYGLFAAVAVAVLISTITTWKKRRAKG